MYRKSAKAKRKMTSGAKTYANKRSKDKKLVTREKASMPVLLKYSISRL